MGKRQSQQGNFQCGYPKLQNMWMMVYFLADTETERQSFKRQLSAFCQNEMLINELMKSINDNGVNGTYIFVELCAMPDKIPFYEKFGFRLSFVARR